jgi:putative CocE/NonD family hydrolase
MTANIDRHAMNVRHNIMVRMRDGVRLATDVFRPMLDDGSAHPGPLPAILVRTSYDKSSGPMVIEPVARFFTRHAYAVVLQDLRGRGLSEGTGQYFHIANVHEGEDGHDTIEWVAAQPWCSGRVGMVGSSHLGIVQNVAALHRPPHLAAIWADVAPTKAIEGCNREGGAMALHVFGAFFCTVTMPRKSLRTRRRGAGSSAMRNGCAACWNRCRSGAAPWRSPRFPRSSRPCSAITATASMTTGGRWRRWTSAPSSIVSLIYR